MRPPARARARASTLVPGGFEPIYHDNHFRLTLGNSQVVLVVNGHRHAVAALDRARSMLEITLHGRILPLPASQAPTCG